MSGTSITVMASNYYKYLGYSSGLYTQHKKGGVCLQFMNIRTGEIVFVIFNADVQRVRNSQNGRVGDLLPDNRFRVNERYGFYKFWLRTELKFPPRLSAFNSYMGNLKKLVFRINSISPGKLDKHSIIPVNINGIEKQIINNQRTVEKQSANKLQTRDTNKQFIESHIYKASQFEQRAYTDMYVNKKQVNKEISNQDIHDVGNIRYLNMENNIDSKSLASVSNIDSKQCETTRIQSQSEEEWMRDFERKDKELELASLEALDRKFKR